MKIVSMEHLLVSGLELAFVLAKAATFRDFSDLFWIALFGILSIKSLIAAFSQKVYDEEEQSSPGE